jgi:hypothetical protein
MLVCDYNQIVIGMFQLSPDVYPCLQKDAKLFWALKKLQVSLGDPLNFLEGKSAEMYREAMESAYKWEEILNDKNQVDKAYKGNI